MKAKTNTSLKLGIISTLLLATAALTLVTFSNKRAEQAFAKEIAQAKSLGLGTSYQYFVREVDPAQNAAHALKPQLASPPSIPAWTTTTGLTYTPQELLDQFATHESDAQIVAQATLLPDWYVERNYAGNPANLTTPEFKGLRAWIKFFNHRGSTKAHLQDFQGAHQDFETAAKLISLQAQERISFGIAIVNGNNYRIIHELLKMVQTANGDPQALQVAQNTLNELPTKTFHEYLAAESATYIHLYMNWSEFATDIYESTELRDPLPVRPPVNPHRLGAKVIGLINQVARINQSAKTLKEAQEQLSKLEELAFPEWTGEALWLPLLMSHYELDILTFMDDQARKNLLQSVLDLWEFKNNHGRFPTPEEFTPQTDPYTDTPLVYRLNNGVPVIYSVGKDFIDNNGDPQKDIAHYLLPGTEPDPPYSPEPVAPPGTTPNAP